MTAKPEYRHPNTKCSICEKPVYRRPNELLRLKNVYCCRKCQGAPRKATLKSKICPQCKKEFTHPSYQPRTYCSLSCSSLARRGRHHKHNKGYLPRNVDRLLHLLEEAKTTHCMIEGCLYENTLDVHRLITGKKGGKYKKGNMFALCPNHHAELHRGVIEVQKVGPYKLKIVRIIAKTQLDKYARQWRIWKMSLIDNKKGHADIGRQPDIG